MALQGQHKNYPFCYIKHILHLKSVCVICKNCIRLIQNGTCARFNWYLQTLWINFDYIGNGGKTTPVFESEIHLSLYWSNGIHNLWETHFPKHFNVITNKMQARINWLCSMYHFTADIYLLNNGIYYYFCICTRWLKWEMGVLHNSLIV